MDHPTTERRGQRGDERPTITIKFGSRADQEAFVAEGIQALKADPKTAVWRFVKTWGCGK
jgi:hypothetical protein